MNSAQEYIAVIGCFQGMLLFGLLVSDGRMTTASRLLGVICLLIAVVFLMPFVVIHARDTTFAWTIGALIFLPVATAPIGYLYCRTALLETSLTRSDLIHLVPVVFCYALLADITLGDPERTMAWLTVLRPDDWRLAAGKIIPFTIALAYAGFASLAIWRYRHRANNNLANFNPMAFSWLLSMQLLSFAVWFFKTLPVFTNRITPSADSIANLLLVALVYLIAIMQWRNPTFFTIPNLIAANTEATIPAKPEDEDGELDPGLRVQLAKTIAEQVESDQLYLDSDLSLARLAAQTGINKHHVSEVLNRQLGKNFYEFINGYRIEFVRRRLAKAPEKTVLEIALEAGFTSKSTFNAVFKQFTGQTPTQFRKTLRST